MNRYSNNQRLKNIIRSATFVGSILASFPLFAADQCNTTAQCRAIYGSGATDCKDSRSQQSVCMCGSERCDAGAPSNPGGSDKIGKFNKTSDLLLLFFDNMPDADDIHSQAAIGMMLKDSRFLGVNYWGVLGAYGRQNAAFLNSSSVMDACLGNSNWANAHPKNGSAWGNAINVTYAKAMNALNKGGDVWIVEAGQSDFSADLVRKIRENSSFNTNAKIHIIQHSNWNQDKTTPSDLSYVRATTDYVKIADGNSANNGSPQFKTNSSQYWYNATSRPNGVGACWSEARKIANDNNYNGNGHWQNPAIAAGGMDFSDTVELAYITGFNYLHNAGSFFNEFAK